jgi:hypothetical protein
MRSVALALLLAALLVTQLTLHSAPAHVLLAASASVLIGCVAAVVVQGGVNWIAVALGAASSLAFGWLAPESLLVATSVMCLLWLAPRVWLARTRKDMALAAGLSSAAAVLSGVVLARYASESLLMHVASCVFAGAALAMAALAGRSDSPLLHRLRVSAHCARGEPRELLEKGVAWLQHAEDPTLSPSAGPDRDKRKVLREMARAGDELLAGSELASSEAGERREALLGRLRTLAQQLEAGVSAPSAEKSAPPGDKSP